MILVNMSPELRRKMRDQNKIELLEDFCFVLHFSPLFFFSLFFLNNINVCSIRKVIKKYEMDALVSKTYFFEFDFLKWHQQKTIIKNYKMGVRMTEMHRKRFFN